MLKEYKSVTEVVGPLMVVQGVEGVKYEELVDIELQDGTHRRGRVLEIDQDKAMVQIFEAQQAALSASAPSRILLHRLLSILPLFLPF